MRFALFCCILMIPFWAKAPLAEEPLLMLASFSDRDNDGIKNQDDQCPGEAEDIDNFRDNDGCPDPDNDFDGIQDGMDKCPRDAEDRDGFEDMDGCPDPDNDGDGIPDLRDKCSNVREDYDGFEDSDGCPDLDNDNDGIPDTLDRCRTEAEDKDGFEDMDGCVDADNDRDGLLDARDKCPGQPETFNGISDEDGCPDEAAAQIPMGQMILEGVRFNGRSAGLDFQSYGVLDSILKILLVFTETELEVIGNVDKSWDPDQDQNLGLEMAQAVCKYWTDRGVAAERLTAASTGSTRPVASNVTPQGREENRRIEIRRTK